MEKAGLELRGLHEVVKTKIDELNIHLDQRAKES
jgi:hypothetical protein